MLKKTNLSVLVIGSGGREHALAWKLAQSPRVAKTYVAPGNGGTNSIAENVAIPVSDIPALLAFAKEHDIDLTVVGPDDVLAAGVVDEFEKAGLAIFGATKAAAQIESSKAFSKQLMAKANVPTATFQIFNDYDAALEYVKSQNRPLVVKASGLALGKGVLLCQTQEEALAALKTIMVDKAFGDAGKEVVIEDMLVGQEISIHALSDGTNSVLFPSSQDHKQIGEGDTGLNTGGMGAIAPVPWVSDELIKRVEAQAVKSIIDELEKAGTRYTGCLYPGLMVDGENFNVLEYNARFGDPETQVYMALLDEDLVDVIESCLTKSLANTALKWKAGFAACVVVASGGYPEAYAKGYAIKGLDEAAALKDVVIFHAGTSIKDNSVCTSGGRVLNVVGRGATLQQALDRAYAAIEIIDFQDMYYRRDIGAKAL